MVFDPDVTRVSGTTLDEVHSRLAQKTIDANIVDSSQVYMTLDDEVLPANFPFADRFITVRYPSLVWAHGDVFIGGGNISEFIVQGQVRITLWLRNELDLFWRAEASVDEAAAAPPRGNRLLGRLFSAFWEDDLLNTDGEAILKRPMLWVSFEPPGPGNRDWKPFRLTLELEFNWQLSDDDTVP
jgi:hypothetical protein